jgi:peptidoglycan/xylan/chitin deacetylase (PgdA/CDA1 family)
LKLKSVSLVLILFFSCSNSKSEIATNNPINIPNIPVDNSPSDVWEIALWKNFSEAAITHTWDDNTAKQLTTAMPIYDTFNLKMTFFIANLWNPDWIGFKKASDNGHEVASHTMTHTSFKDLTSIQIEKELSDSKDIINKQLGNDNCITFAYPYCVSESFNLTKNYYVAARGCDGKIVSSSPKDFMNISSFVCGTESSYQTASHFNALADNAFNQKGWGVYLFHGIDNDGGYSPIDSKELTKHLEYLNNNKSKFWVATFSDVVKYIQERDNTIINQVRVTDTEMVCNFTNNLNSSIFNFPLTIKKQLPTTWKNSSVKQNNVAIKFEIVTISSKKYIVFNAVPNAGEINILKL